MADEKKLKNLLKKSRDIRDTSEAESWMFSLIPVFVAFVIYIMFILSMDITQKNIFIAYGAASFIIGLQSYWIVRGWLKHHASTISMGVIGIVITLGLLKLYLSLQ